MTLKFSKIKIFLFSSLLFDLLGQDLCEKQPQAELSPQIVSGLGVKAYIFAYPLVLMDVTKKVMTNVASPTEFFAPINQFAHSTKFVKPKFNKLNKLEPDTLYSTAWLDLEKEPIILHVPNTRDRYYLMEAFDNWTNLIASIGKREMGTVSQDLIFVGPNWRGDIPAGLKMIKSHTNIVRLVGKFFPKDKRGDLVLVNRIQKQFTLKPLSFLNKDYIPVENKIDPNIDMNALPVDIVERIHGLKFFNYFADLLKSNPVSREDLNYLKSFEPIGIIPKQDFDANRLSASLRENLDDVPSLALDRIYSALNLKNNINNGWSMIAQPSEANYLKRAVNAYNNLGVSRSEDLLYETVKVGSNGKLLQGHSRYVIHFDRLQVPSTRAFWSITMYDKNLLFVDNSLKRYSVGDRGNLKYNRDGSLDIYIQRHQPEDNKKSNWLPAPAGYFELILRVYWPNKNMLRGSWRPPAVTFVPEPEVEKSLLGRLYDQWEEEGDYL